MNLIQRLEVKKSLSKLKIKDIKQLIELAHLELIKRDREIKKHK